MITKPEVSWSTLASDVELASGLYRYKFKVNPLDPNESGAYPTILEVGDWFIDYAGYPFLIEEVNGDSIVVYDVNERGNGTTSAYGPYNNKVGYIYRPIGNAIVLTQAQLRKLDPSAIDVIQNIEKGIIWKYRGIKVTSTNEIDNVTNLELENLEVTNVSDNGWQGGKKVKIKFNKEEQLYTKVIFPSHGFNNDIVYYDSISKTWVKAIANNEETCGSHLAVKIDNDNFILINNGNYTIELLDENNEPLVPGEYYFLSQTNPGKITKIKPESGITQYILQSLENNLVEINIEEPYEINFSSSSGGSNVYNFLDLEDTPSIYEENKFLYTTIDGITFKTPLITDILNLESTLLDKANLSQPNTFTNTNVFNNTVYLKNDIYIEGLQESITNKILYINLSNFKISYGDVPSGTGTPSIPIKTIQFNNNGQFGATTFYYDQPEDKYGLFGDPFGSDALFTIYDSNDRVYNNYNSLSFFKVYGQKDFGLSDIFKIDIYGAKCDTLLPINSPAVNMTLINISDKNVLSNSVFLGITHGDLDDNIFVLDTVLYGGYVSSVNFPLNGEVVYNYYYYSYLGLTHGFTYYEGNIVVLIKNSTQVHLFNGFVRFYELNDSSIYKEYELKNAIGKSLYESYGLTLNIIKYGVNNLKFTLKKEEETNKEILEIKSFITLKCYSFNPNEKIEIPLI